MKSFPCKVETKLCNFIKNGERIARETANYSKGRTLTQRYDNVKNNLNRRIDAFSPFIATVHYYGSRVMGTSNFKSNLNFYVKVDKTEDAKYILAEVKDALEMNGTDEWKICVFLPDFDLPVLRVIWKKTNFKCDITASCGSSLNISRMFNHLNSIQPQIVPMFHYIRIWLRHAGVSIKNYFIYLLLLFYLQRKNFMPTIERIQRNMEDEYVDGFNVQFDPNRTLPSYGVKKINDYLELIPGYFKYYSDIDFSQLVLSTYNGLEIDRDDYEPNSHLFNLEKPLCIAGPLDDGEILGKLPAVGTLEKFQRVCQLSVEFLKAHDL